MTTTEVDRIRDQIAAMQAEIADSKRWEAVHDVSCASRYRELKDSMSRSNHLLITATTALGLIAVGLKSRFGEEFLKLLGLL